MKIALIGSGKMGKAIEEMAKLAGHHIYLRIDSKNIASVTAGELSEADVAIEFTRPDAAADNLIKCLEAKVPVVCGTTGWIDRYEEVSERFMKNSGSLLTASNFSVGVQLFFRLSRELAALMNRHPQYAAHLKEIHHIHKLDKPSGTALHTVNEIMEAHPSYHSWALSVPEQEFQSDILPVESLREADVIGIHEISWSSPIDKISLRHEAFNRDGFAQGALLAAEWLIGRKGVFTMEDVLFGK